jgi:hypothetical protein
VLQLAIKGAPHSSSKRCFTAVAAYFCISFMSLCAHRTRESRPLKPPPVATPARVDGRSSFWGAQLCATAHLYERLLPSDVSFCSTTSWWCALLYHYFQKYVRGMALLPFFLHQIRSTTGPASGYNLELSFTCHVLSVLIQIKRRYKQSL